MLGLNVRPDGTDLYGKSESLRGARGGPDRRRVPAARRNRQYLKRAHGVLVRDGGLESEAHRAYVNDPVYLERMEMVNDLCSWLKRCLWRFTGMSPRNLQATSTGTSTSSGSTRPGTDGAPPQGWCAIF